MKFREALIEGQFIRRYKRFFADIQWGERVIVAHVPNTGSLKGCLVEGAPCRFTVSDNPQRKLKYTLQMIKVGRSWVGINTHLANLITWEAFENRCIPHWKKFRSGRREVRVSDSSRLDFVFCKDEGLLEAKKIDPLWFKDTRHGVFHFVEVKNVTFRVDHSVQFPDAVTLRGQKHLLELIRLVKAGHSAEIFFTVQRRDGQFFAPADEVDPEYGYLLREAKRAGVLISPYICQINSRGVKVDESKRLRLRL